MIEHSRSVLRGLGGPRSLWEATAAAGPELQALQTREKADVVVVGGGIAGLSAALHLAQSGSSVTVLEAAQVGHGASGRNGGQIIPGLKRDPDELIGVYGVGAAEPMIDFAGRSADVLFDLVSKYKIDCNAVRHGWIQAAHDSEALRLAHDRARQWSARGAPVAALNAAEVTEMSGAIGYRGGWIDRRAGRLHPLDFTRGLARASLGLGAQIYERSRVRDIAPDPAGWRLVTEGGQISAAKVILCMNAYADPLWSGLVRSYIPVSTFQLASKPLAPAVRASILQCDIAVSDMHPLLRYFRCDGEGRLIMGGPGSVMTLRQPTQILHLLESVARLFPQLRERYTLEFYWGGDVAITLDHIPHLHDLGSGVYAYLGCNGRGVALAASMGKLLARLALGAHREEIPFRFSELRPIALHAAHPLYVQALTTYYTLKERFKRPPMPTTTGRTAAESKRNT